MKFVRPLLIAALALPMIGAPFTADARTKRTVKPHVVASAPVKTTKPVKPTSVKPTKAAATDAPAVPVAPIWVGSTAENPRECWISASPQKSIAKKDGKEAKVTRGEVKFVASWRAGMPVEFSFTGGYPFKAGSEPVLIIDGKRHALMTQGDWSWLKDVTESEAVLAEMRAGNQMVVSAISARETKTEDFFSLKGISAKIDETIAACK